MTDHINIEDLEYSDIMRKALNELERIDFEFEVEEPSAKRIKGKLALQLRQANDG